MSHLIQGKTKDLGDGFNVLRILPHVDARSVGPFVFVDHFGPAPVVTGVPLPPGGPRYELELWVATALLAVTFPLIVVVTGYFDFWPLKRARTEADPH